MRSPLIIFRNLTLHPSLMRRLMAGIAGCCLSLALAAPMRVEASVLGTISAQAGEVRDLAAVNTTTMFAATQGGGLWKTTNGGASWSAVPALPARYVWKLAIAGNATTIYAATTSGVFKSANAGATWNQLTADPARAIAVDPTDPAGNKFLVGVAGAGIVRSNDGGSTFVDVSGGLDSTDTRAIVFDPAGNAFAALFGSTAPGANWGGVFRLPSGGSTWTNWNTAGGGAAINSKFVTSLAANATVLLAGTQDPNSGDGRVHRSLLGGGGWSNPPGPGDQQGYLAGVESLALDRSSAGGGNAFYAGSRTLCVYRTTDGGLNWFRQGQATAANTEVCANIYAVGSFPGATTNVAVAAKGSGLFYTTAPSTGVTWTRASGLAADRVRSFAASAAAGTLYLGLDGGGVRRSTDGGTSWLPLLTGIPKPNGVTEGLYPVNALAAHPTNAALVYAGMRGVGLYQFSSGTWSVVNGGALTGQGSGDNKPQDLAFNNNGNNLFYSLFDIGQGPFRNVGGTWSLPAYGPEDLNGGGSGAARFYTSPTNANLVFALRYDERMQRSIDGGNTWSQVVAPVYGFMRTAFISIGENPFAPTRMLAATNMGIYNSADSGATWSRMSIAGALRQTTFSALLYSPTTNVMVWGADFDGNFYCSADEGQSWNFVARLAAPVSALRYRAPDVWALTDGAGIVRLSATCP
jgi:hypothetical protein